MPPLTPSLPAPAIFTAPPSEGSVTCVLAHTQPIQHADLVRGFFVQELRASEGLVLPCLRASPSEGLADLAAGPFGEARVALWIAEGAHQPVGDAEEAKPAEGGSGLVGA